MAASRSYGIRFLMISMRSCIIFFHQRDLIFIRFPLCCLRAAFLFSKQWLPSCFDFDFGPTPTWVYGLSEFFRALFLIIWMWSISEQSPLEEIRP